MFLVSISGDRVIVRSIFIYKDANINTDNDYKDTPVRYNVYELLSLC